MEIVFRKLEEDETLERRDDNVELELNTLRGHIESFDIHISEWDDELMTDTYYDNEYFNEEHEDVPFVIGVNYPLSGIAFACVSAKTYLELGYRICDIYKQIYKEEFESSEIQEDYIENSYNRKRTNGKYGIWGHMLGDLVLEGVRIHKNDDDPTKPRLVTLCVGS